MQQKCIHMLDSQSREAVVNTLCQVSRGKTLMKTKALDTLFDNLVE